MRELRALYGTLYKYNPRELYGFAIFCVFDRKSREMAVGQKQKKLETVKVHHGPNSKRNVLKKHLELRPDNWQ